MSYVIIIIIIIIRNLKVTPLFLRTFMTRRLLQEFICTMILVLVFLLYICVWNGISKFNSTSVFEK